VINGGDGEEVFERGLDTLILSFVPSGGVEAVASQEVLVDLIAKLAWKTKEADRCLVVNSAVEIVSFRYLLLRLRVLVHT